MRTFSCFLGLLAVVTAPGVGPAPAAGQQPAPATSASSSDRRDLDKAVFMAVRKAMIEAADLYNAGNPTASYTRFRQTLDLVDPLLAHRPQLQIAVRQGLESTGRLPNVDRQAWALHYLSAQVYSATQPPRIGEGKTLWERLGGEENVTKIVDDFLALALDDKAVNLNRNDRFPMDRERLARFKSQLVALTSAVAGGPYKYQGKSMKLAHKDMGITDAEFDALLPHLRIALTRNQVQAKEVMAIMDMIPTIRGEIVAPPTVPANEPQRILSLWDRLGGEAKVERIVNEFVDQAVSNPRVNFSRNGKFKLSPMQVAQLKRQFVNLASQVSGGPYKYDGRTMKELHLGMRITDEEFDALLLDLKTVMNKHQVNPLEFALIVKAIELTRKDVVEGTGMLAPAPMQPGAPGNPPVPPASPKSRGRPAGKAEARAPRTSEFRSDTVKSSLNSEGDSPVGSFILWAIRSAGLETSASKSRAGGDHVP